MGQVPPAGFDGGQLLVRVGQVLGGEGGVGGAQQPLAVQVRLAGGRRGVDEAPTGSTNCPFSAVSMLCIDLARWIFSVVFAVVLGLVVPVGEVQAAPTGGSGGALIDRTFLAFTGTQGSSQYHLFAGGLDWSKEVGLLIYADGSGEYGLKNPTSSYLLGGTSGLVAVAKQHNMILLTPLAPGGDCPDGGGTCWYQTSGGLTPTQKAQWSYELAQQVKTQYSIDTDRIAFGGYSSGAQWATEYFGPLYASTLMSDGVAVAISYGGAPLVTPTFTPTHKATVAYVWDTGSNDPAYASTGNYGVQGGHAWYARNGFTTELHVVPGQDHSRSGQFGPILDREITDHVPPPARRCRRRRSSQHRHPLDCRDVRDRGHPAGNAAEDQSQPRRRARRLPGRLPSQHREPMDHRRVGHPRPGPGDDAGHQPHHRGAQRVPGRLPGQHDSLWVTGTLGTQDLDLGMMRDTSPSITAVPGGHQVAFQANTGSLWTTGALGTQDLGLGMMPGTSPSITAVPGGYQVAFQANTGSLWTTGALGTQDLGLGMMPGTSPSITAVPGGYQVAFQANTTSLWVTGAQGTEDKRLGMLTETSPSIATVAAGYQVAFQANTTSLWTTGALGTQDTHLGMMRDTSPGS